MRKRSPNKNRKVTDKANPNYKTFANRIYNLRMERGYTLSDLEAISDEIYHDKISKGAWSRYEKALIEPTASKLRMIASIYGVSVDYLIGLVDDYGGHNNTVKEPELTTDEIKVLKAYKAADEVGKRNARYILNTRKAKPKGIIKKEQSD